MCNITFVTNMPRSLVWLRHLCVTETFVCDWGICVLVWLKHLCIIARKPSWNPTGEETPSTGNQRISTPAHSIVVKIKHKGVSGVEIPPLRSFLGGITCTSCLIHMCAWGIRVQHNRCSKPCSRHVTHVILRIASRLHKSCVTHDLRTCGRGLLHM